MKELKIKLENGVVGIEDETKELTKEDAILLVLSAYIGICEEYDVSPINLLINGLRSAQEGE